METPPESDTTAVNFNDTELTLWLPGGPRPPTVIGRYTGVKRGHSETIDLNLGSSNILPRGKICASGNESESEVSSTRKPTAAKAQVVGWPPLRSCRKKALESCTYVKVAVDGAPYLRKVDLEAYRSYQELLRALEEMFTCFTIRCNPVDESKLMDMVKGIEYVPTYEDNDGDWMLVGDVPWKMFKESCKRIRLMKSSESLEIAQEIPSKCKRTE